MEESDFAKGEKQRRFVIYVDGKIHCETVDYNQAFHVKQLLCAEGKPGVVSVTVKSLTANQKS